MDTKFCRGCSLEKSVSDFYKNRAMKDGMQPWCKPCHLGVIAKAFKEHPERKHAAQKRYRDKYPERCKLSDVKWRAKNPANALRKDADRVARWRKRNPNIVRETVAHLQRAKNATPKWRETDKMRIVYKKAREYGFEVDHIVPLKHPLVCGLHVWGNLQLLSRKVNRSKNNHAWPDMP